MKRWGYGWKRIAGAGAVVALCAFAFAWFGMMGAPLGQQPNAGEAPAAEPAVLLAGEDAAISGEAAMSAESTMAGEAAQPYGGAPYEPGVVLVTLEGGANPDQVLAQLAADTGLNGLSVQDSGAGYALLALPEGMATEEAVNVINASGSVGAAQPNFIYTVQGEDAAGSGESPSAYVAATMGALATQADPNDPLLAEQWALTSINVSGAWEKVPSDRHVGVAILDEGFNVDHEDLKSRVKDRYNAAGGARTDVSPSVSGSNVTQGHGTHVAGIIGAETNNGVGVAGVTGNHADLVLVKVYNASGTATSATLVNAYDYLFTKAEALNIRVVNCSVGSTRSNGPTGDDAAVHARIDKAHDEYGIVTVCSAGNAGGTSDATSYNFPSDYEKAVSVMSLARIANGDGTYRVERLSTSSYNASTTTQDDAGKNICAPGGSIMSTFWKNGAADNDSNYGELSGSSMAAPHVAGVLALMFAARPELTAPEAVSRLYESATDLGPTGWDPGYGYGEVNAVAALSQEAIDIKEAHITWPACVFTGEPQKPTPVVKLNGVALKAGTDFTVTHPVDGSSWVAGTPTATINAKGAFYKGSVESQYTIEPADIADAEITLAATSYKYDGEAKEPRVATAKFGTRTLNNGVDFTVSYEDNIEVGTANAVLTGKSNFTGTKKVPFKIVGESSDPGIDDPVSDELSQYAGTARKSKFTDLVPTEWYMQTKAGTGAFPNTETLYLDYVMYNNLMGGYANTALFGPSDTLKRAEAATIIYRLANPGSAATTDPAYYAQRNDTNMVDVEAGAYYTAAVNWCFENQVITGFLFDDHAEFRPFDNISREQIATIVARYCTACQGKAQAASDISGYSDYSRISAWARSGVSYCLNKGIMSGYSGKNAFGPQDDTNRAQMAKIIAVVATSD